MEKLAPDVAALVIDLDDTLYPELDYVRSGLAAVAANLSSPAQDSDAVLKLLDQAFQRGPRDRVFNAVLQQLGCQDDPTLIAELVQLYRNHRPSLHLEDSVARMLERLRCRYKLGLLSDGFLPAQQLKLEALHLETAFDATIFTEDLGRQFWKPAPRAFEMIARQLGCEPRQCVYIADNPAKDFIAPNQLGWQTVQVRLPHGVHQHHQDAENSRPQFVIAHVTELESLLG